MAIIDEDAPVVTVTNGDELMTRLGEMKHAEMEASNVEDWFMIIVIV